MPFNMETQACPACGDCALLEPEGVCEICLLLRELVRGIESTVLHQIHALEAQTLQLTHLVSRLQQQQLHWTQRRLLARQQQQLRPRQSESESSLLSPIHEH